MEFLELLALGGSAIALARGGFEARHWSHVFGCSAFGYSIFGCSVFGCSFAASGLAIAGGGGSGWFLVFVGLNSPEVGFDVLEFGLDFFHDVALNDG
jgi:hypothetical protein